MEPNKQLFEAWQNGVQLGHAWWVFADAQNKKRFRGLQREGGGSHLGLQRSLEIDLVARISGGELQAIGIEDGSDAGPILIPPYYFSKTAEIDWDKETVVALGRKFHEVTVQGEREPLDWVPREPELVDPQLIRWEPESVAETLASEPAPSSESLNQGERQSPDEASPNEPALSGKRPTGRPPLIPMVRDVIRELMSRDAFTGLAKWEIERLIRRKARERFPTWFPKPDRPTRNTINKALRLEGWPTPPKK
jgi:hypothetical protein